MRSLMQGWTAQKAPGRAAEPVVDADGGVRTRERRQSRQLRTIFGPIIVERTGYGADGEASLHPLDAQLNLPEDGYSLEVRRRVAIEASRCSFDEVVETLAETTGAVVPKRQAEELVERAAQDFDAFYAARQAAAEEASEPIPELVVISADGKGVAMRREDLRKETRAAATAAAADGQDKTMRRRVTRAEAKNGKRMATVAAVYAVAPYVRTPDQVARELARGPRKSDPEPPPPRPRPHNKRVWASLEHEPRDVIQDAFQEASSRDVGRTKTWVAVVDGNEHQLDLLEAASQRHAAPITIVIDLFHVLMYVWHAGRALEGDDDKRIERWVIERMQRILEGEAVSVAAGMRRSATRRGLEGAPREAVDVCANYLLKYRDYLRYHEYLAAGMPIASGVIEGACRHLVQDRMGITGARWCLAGAESVLRIRALRSSRDFDEYWKFHEARELELLGDAIHGLDRIVLVDLCAPLLDTARARIERRGWRNVELVHADATTFNALAGQADIVALSYALTMIPDWFAAIEVARDALKPGGHIGVVDFHVTRARETGPCPVRGRAPEPLEVVPSSRRRRGPKPLAKHTARA